MISQFENSEPFLARDQHITIEIMDHRHKEDDRPGVQFSPMDIAIFLGIIVPMLLMIIIPNLNLKDDND